MIKALAVALALVACSKKEDKSETKAPDKPAADAAAKSAADLFTGAKPALPEPIAKLAYGLPEAAAKAAAPDVFAAKYGYKPPGYDGVEIDVQIEGGRVYQTRMKVKEPIETVKGWLAAKWGEPRAGQNSIGSPEFYWEAPDVGLRVKLEKSATSSMVRFDPVMSIEQVLGDDPKAFGFEKVPLLGASQDDVMKAYEIYRPKVRDDDPGSIAITLPAIASHEYGATLSIRVKDGKVTGYTASIPTKFTDKLVPRLEAMFGPGKLDGTKLYTDYKGPPKLKAELRTDEGFSSTLWVGDYKK